MNDDMKKRYELLKQNNKEKILKSQIQNNTLYKECIDVLCGCKILSMKDSCDIFKTFETKYPITKSGHVNWNDFDGNVKNNLTVDFIKNNMDLHTKYYILWDMPNIPCVLCDLFAILNDIDEVLAVSFNTWLLSENMKNLVEFDSLGRITLGFC